ncbi:DUF2339 domain-containing protein [Candidatus Thiothrix sp. Deng01]|uniref:DUF2339 domain-containing protein n=1 Tax=Candidatus Thiothrix phosphatis TaxID=3112415 RepID=A0ABU6CYP5_9GAMM|nr:DUF2339 domain-containing protein [Candidatus Thiothrix sp. Deng01]MEB4591213.1 DUF2339 domain-containing protein [Candidatus Thiothrix sp. Deng01]
MHPAAFAVIAALMTSVAYLVTGYDDEWISIVMAACIGYLWGKANRTAKALEQLRAAMAKDWEQRQAAVSKQAEVTVPRPVAAIEPPLAPPPDEPLPIPKPAPKLPSERPRSIPEERLPPAQPEPALPEPSFLEDAVFRYIKAYFTGGNLFVRIGILVLFLGVSFLLKYVSDQGLLPIEYRLAGVAAGAIFLLGLGWRLREKKAVYALLLQGAGIGVLYLDVFAAFSLYSLMPPLPAFGLLFVVSMLAAALAVLQDARSLAVLGFSGGFLAPILASSGSGNYIGLFSYYAVLNVAIAVIAWFKTWRPLNLLGFAFTFVIGVAWGAFDYSPEKFATTEPFLVFFFLLYVGIAVLYALRQPPNLKGYVDGSLLFGVPLATAGLQYGMVREMPYGVALSAFCMGVFYVLLSRFVWQRKGDALRLLAEAFLALGVIFTSLAIPFALAPTHTAAAWALEGMGMLWLGTRQNRLSVRAFGMLLQLGAAMFVSYYLLENLATADFRHQYVFLNASFISTSLMAIAGVGSAWLLHQDFDGRKSWEVALSPAFLLWGLGWLYGGFFIEFTTHLDTGWLPANLLLLSAAVSFGFGVWALRTRWTHALWVALALLAVMFLLALPVLDQPSQHGGWVAWPLAFAVLYSLLFRLDQNEDFGIRESLLKGWHSAAFLLLVALLTLDGWAHLQTLLGRDAFLADVWMAASALAGLWWLLRAHHWPLSRHLGSYRQQAGSVLAAYLLLWSLHAIISAQAVSPLPWLPLLNPLDIATGIIALSLFYWWRVNRDVPPLSNLPAGQLLIGVAGLGFLWLNMTLFRVAHYVWGIPFQLETLLANSFVQTALSVLWALSGVLVTVLASRKQQRKLWIAGGVLLGIVVLKLFLVDLSQQGNLARILSFLIVGGLLVSIGYFAPLPGDNKNAKNAEVPHEA